MLTSKREFQLGLSNASIPIPAPGNVKAYITIMAIITNTAGIKIFEATPIPSFMDLWEEYYNAEDKCLPRSFSSYTKRITPNK